MYGKRLLSAKRIHARLECDVNATCFVVNIAWGGVDLLADLRRVPTFGVAVIIMSPLPYYL